MSFTDRYEAVNDNPASSAVQDLIGSDPLSDKPTGSVLPFKGKPPAGPVLDAADPSAPPADLVNAFGTATGRKAANDAYVIQQADSRREEDRERARKAFDATGIGPDATPKWDADAESKKYSTDPIAKFGSLGSVVGMLASAFTHHPMQNALNASAAAMNAISEHDEEGYQRAHQAWKENTDLVFKRAELEQKRFTDAMTLMHADATTATAKLYENAVMEGDEKGIAMINAGMVPEYVKAKSDQATAIEKLRKVTPELQLDKFVETYTKPMMEQAQKLFGPDSPHPDPQKLAGAMIHIAQLKGFLKDEDIDRQALGNWMAKRLQENKFEAIPFEEVMAKIQEIKQASNPWRTTAGGAAGAIPGRINAAGIEAQLKQEEEKGTLDTKDAAAVNKRRAELNKQQKEESTPLSPHDKGELLEKIGRLDRGVEVIKDTEGMLKKYAGIAGLGGRFNRPFETFADMLGGSKSTAYHRFESNIDLLRQWERGLLSNAKATGRDLKAAEQQISTIIPGLSMGQPPQFVSDQLGEVMVLLNQTREEDAARWKGTATPETSKEITGGKKSSGGDWRRIAIPAGP